MISKGFTLIEILIVVLILALVALGIIAMLPAGYEQVRRAGRLSALNHLGQEKMDQLKALGYNHGDLLNGFHPSQPDIRLTDTEFQGYSIVWNVVDDNPSPGVKTVTVEAGYMTYDENGVAITNPNQKNQLKQQFTTYIVP
jgi:prepilin-type N-terminal cleavage/methylation domain-containing protein